MSGGRTSGRVCLDGPWEDAFGYQPATAMVGVAGLLDPRMLVEIEVEAYREAP